MADETTRSYDREMANSARTELKARKYGRVLEDDRSEMGAVGRQEMRIVGDRAHDRMQDYAARGAARRRRARSGTRK